MAFHKVIGIDLGTTYSAVSVWDGKDVVIIPSAQGANSVPSVVGLDPETKVIVGAPAQANLVSDAANTIIEVKREMGTYDREPNPQRDDPGVPTRKRFRGREYLPQEISAFILMELKRQAESYIGEPIHDAVITVPAYFKEPQRAATEDAAHMARLNVKRLLNEPTAAAVCFGADKVQDDRRHIYAVYDLGGGTFDVSIIAVTAAESVSVVGTGGNPRLGGGDFDDLITGYALQQIKNQHGVDLSQDPAVWQRIKREAEMRKRDLASTGAATLSLPWLTPQLSSVNVTITRATFETLIDDLLKESLACLDEAMESAGENNSISRDDIEQVLLVGGSTRIPRVRSMLAKHLGMEEKDVRCDFSPDEVVARGAGMVARDYHPSDGYEGEEIVIEVEPGLAEQRPAMILQDVTGHTLGILVNQSDFFPIIPKESHIPRKETHGGFTNGGRGSEIPVLIFQGEKPVAFDNTLIGKLPIYLPEPKDPGEYKFEVTFSLDLNGLLSVEIKCLNPELSGETWRTEVQCNVRATPEQIDESAKHLQEVMASSEQAADGAVPTEIGSLPKPPGARATPTTATAAGMPQPPAPTAVAPAPTSEPQVHPYSETTAYAAPQPTSEAYVPPSPESTVSPPSEDVPEAFRRIAQRSYSLLGELAPSPQRDKLLATYRAFLDAVQAHPADLESVGEALENVYHDCR
jgi:molecular chaperone DnaK